MNQYKLTAKQEKFAQLVVKLDDQTEAYRQAYDTKAKPKTIWEQASKTAAYPKVRARIEALRAEIIEKYKKDTEVTIEMVRNQLRRFMMVDVRKLYNKDGSLKSITELDDDTAAAISGLSVEERQIVEDDDVAVLSSKVKNYKLVDKISAAEKLGKHLGMFVDRHEIKAEVETKESSDMELARWIAFTLSKTSK